MQTALTFATPTRTIGTMASPGEVRYCPMLRVYSVGLLSRDELKGSNVDRRVRLVFVTNKRQISLRYRLAKRIFRFAIVAD